MTSEIVGGLTQEKEHDWSKPCLVKINTDIDGNEGLIVFATSEDAQDEAKFSGVVLHPSVRHKVGSYREDWFKSSFTPITEPITIKFTP